MGSVGGIGGVPLFGFRLGRLGFRFFAPFRLRRIVLARFCHTGGDEAQLDGFEVFGALGIGLDGVFTEGEVFLRVVVESGAELGRQGHEVLVGLAHRVHGGLEVEDAGVVAIAWQLLDDGHVAGEAEAFDDDVYVALVFEALLREAFAVFVALAVEAALVARVEHVVVVLGAEERRLAFFVHVISRSWVGIGEVG